MNMMNVPTADRPFGGYMMACSGIRATRNRCFSYCIPKEQNISCIKRNYIKTHCFIHLAINVSTAYHLFTEVYSTILHVRYSYSTEETMQGGK